MTRVRIVCDSNFRKTEDVDESVAKVLKMFSQYFVKKMAPLNEESDMECVYIYDNLTPEKVRLLKRLLNHNKTLLNFKEIIISKPGGSTNSSDTESSNSSTLGTDKGSKHGSFHSSMDSSLVKSSILSPSFTSDGLGEELGAPSDDLNNNRFSEVANKLRELADEVENLLKP